MAKVSRKDLLITQRVFEARYERGYRYLDRCGDSYSFTIDLAALASVVFGMWASAVNSSDQHKAILTILEQAVLSATTLNDAQISALRSALVDLSSEVLTESHVEVTRTSFIDEGFSPMALLSEIDNIAAEPGTD